MPYEPEYWLAKNAAKVAGNFLKNFDPRKVSSQIGRDIKLAADREAEAVILGELASSHIPVLSEERGEVGDYSGGLRWIVDPLDGSYNYFKGLNELCCVSIALWDGDRPILGVINRFNAREIIAGIVGGGATLNDLPISPGRTEALNQACCATGLSVKGDFSRSRLEEYLALMSKMKKVRMLGAAAIMSSFVACGRMDIYTEKDILLWDVAAGIAIVQAAGGLADFRLKEDFKCDVACFATEALRQEFKSKIG